MYVDNANVSIAVCGVEGQDDVLPLDEVTEAEFVTLIYVEREQLFLRS